MRKLVLTLLSVLCLATLVHGQNRQITGTVTSEGGTAMPGVSVVVKGTQNGVITDRDGHYAITTHDGAVLQFSFIGMSNREVTVTSASSVYNVTMSEDTYNLDQVVITASGMTRSEKTLGYASVTIGAEDLTVGKSSSVMDGLMAKVPGLNISNTGGAGTSQKVLVRGYSSLSESNQPLYVIDGVPISNNFSGVGGVDGLNNAIDFGTQVNDINPDDVESVTVLKGASATALYGSRAANGVIVITTKRGNRNQDIRVTYDGSFMGSSVLRTPVTQETFGQGWYGSFYFQNGIENYHGAQSRFGFWDSHENGSWGPKLDGRLHEWNVGAWYDGLGDRQFKHYNYAKNSVRNFYETGFETNNNISVSGGNENTGFMVSYGNTYSDGILPGNKDYFKRNNFGFRGNTTIKNGLAVLNYSVNYVRKDIQNAMDGQGGNGSTIYGDLMQYPVDIDYKDLKDYNSIYNDADHYYTPYAVNPWWIVDNNRARYQDDRVYGSLDLQIQLLPGLKAIGRVGGDFTNARVKIMNSELNHTKGYWNNLLNASDETGYLNEYTQTYHQIDASALLNADYQVGDFSLNGVFGWNLNQRYSYKLEGEMEGLLINNWYNLDNTNMTPSVKTTIRKRRLIGLLGQAEVGFKDYLYLTLSGRNDWSSTLPIDNNSFFYWGTNLSFILTQAVPSLRSDVLNFAKLRVAYGQTGNDASEYLTTPYYTKPDMVVGFGNLTYPLNGVSGFVRYPRAPSTDLKPEISTELEFGVDLRLLDNRLRIDASYYTRDTKNQILAVTAAPEIGYTTRTANVGKIRNRGVELLVGVTPVRTKDWTWDLTWTFAKNNSKLLELWDGNDEYTIYGLSSGASVVAKVGEPLFVMTYNPLRKVTDKDSEHYGKVIVNATTGFPTIDSNSTEVVGKTAPDFTMGFNNHLRWKDISLNFNLDWRKGGVMRSASKNINYFVGNAPETTYNDRNPFIVQNSVIEVSEGVYRENNIPIDLFYGGVYAYYYRSYNASAEREYLISKTYVKLRELSLGYSLPKKWFAGKAISGMEVSFVGRNLLMWTPSQGFVDPDQTNYGNDVYSEYGEYYSAPTTRTFGGSIKIVF